MNLLSLFSRKPERVHTVPRFHAATKAESAAVRQRQASIRCQLAVYAATTTPEQRLAETEEFFRAAKAAEKMRRGA